MKKALSFIIALVLLLGLCIPASAFSAVSSAQKLTVDGESINCEKYNIDGSNYFKLRDLAYLLNGTAGQFDVGWDASAGVVSITTDHAYTTATGSELVIGQDQSSTAQPSAQTIKINGEVRTDLSVYNIGGNNYFKLRDLGTALGFGVDYDAATNTAVVISSGKADPSGDAVPLTVSDLNKIVQNRSNPGALIGKTYSFEGMVLQIAGLEANVTIYPKADGSSQAWNPRDLQVQAFITLSENDLISYRKALESGNYQHFLFAGTISDVSTSQPAGQPFESVMISFNGGHIIKDNFEFTGTLRPYHDSLSISLETNQWELVYDDPYYRTIIFPNNIDASKYVNKKITVIIKGFGGQYSVEKIVG